MKKSVLLLAAMAACVSFPALAADMPVKAPQQRILLTYQGRGWYYGLHTFADNTKLETSGTTTSSSGLLSGLGGTFDVGASVGLTGGFMWGDGTSWKAIEVMASYKNIGTDPVAVDATTGVAIPTSMSSKWSFTERFKFGGPLATVLNLLPNLNLASIFPVLPNVIAPGAVADTTHPYLFGAFHQDQIAGQFGAASGQQWKLKGGFGVGAMTQLSSGVVMDVWAEYIPTTASVTLGNANGSSGSVATSRESRIGVTFAY